METGVNSHEKFLPKLDTHRALSPEIDSWVCGYMGSKNNSQETSNLLQKKNFENPFK